MCGMRRSTHLERVEDIISTSSPDTLRIWPISPTSPLVRPSPGPQATASPATDVFTRFTEHIVEAHVRTVTRLLPSSTYRSATVTDVEVNPV
ncbi:hypothetical protein RRG08_002654 [Elysia crispata]|uniref:Uncharacterized protein n=1 Tax=Elysia crispata TaxID=231223 RepID=A0AAE0XTT2_9GAST|nr:hypothetical protein RRG08_002654 [Elysia crispata]